MGKIEENEFSMDVVEKCVCVCEIHIHAVLEPHICSLTIAGTVLRYHESQGGSKVQV